MISEEARNKEGKRGVIKKLPDYSGINNELMR